MTVTQNNTDVFEIIDKLSSFQYQELPTRSYLMEYRRSHKYASTEDKFKLYDAI